VQCVKRCPPWVAPFQTFSASRLSTRDVSTKWPVPESQIRATDAATALDDSYKLAGHPLSCSPDYSGGGGAVRCALHPLVLGRSRWRTASRIGSHAHRRRRTQRSPRLRICRL